MTIRISDLGVWINFKGDLEGFAIEGAILDEKFRGVIVGIRNNRTLNFITRSPWGKSIMRYHLSKVADRNGCLVSSSYGAVNITPRDGYYQHYNFLLRKLESLQHNGRKRK